LFDVRPKAAFLADRFSLFADGNFVLADFTLADLFISFLWPDHDVWLQGAINHDGIGLDVGEVREISCVW
jgi:hypothetical protein